MAEVEIPLLHQGRTWHHVVMIFTLITIFIPMVHHSPSHYIESKFVHLSDPFYDAAMRICVGLCVPVLVETSLDYLFTPSTSRYHLEYALHSYKFIIVLGIFVPTLVIVYFCMHTDRYNLFSCASLSQVMLLAYPTLYLLNYYDNYIWTNTRTSVLLLSFSSIGWFMTVFFSLNLVSFQYLAVASLSLSMILTCALLVVWGRVHSSVIRSMCFLRSDYPVNVSTTRVLSIYYVVVLVIFGLICTPVSTPAMATATRFRVVSAAQLICLCLIVLLPGRLARLDAVHSDVCGWVTAGFFLTCVDFGCN